MRVVLKTIYAGPGGSHQPGATVDLPESEARALVAGEYAVAAPGGMPPAMDAPEVATIAAPETAAPRARGRVRR